MAPNTLTLGVVTIALLLSGGCSTSRIAGIERDVESNAATVGKYVQIQQEGKKVTAAPMSSNLVERTDGTYLPVRRIADSRSSRRDPFLSKQITLNRMVYSVQDLAERITLLSGVPVIVAPDVTVPAAGAATAPLSSGVVPTPATAASAATPTAAGGLPPLPLPGASMLPGSNLPSTNGFPMTMSYSGPLSGLLEVATSRMGVSWRSVDGQIRIFRLESKTYRLNALPGDTALDAKVSNTTGGGTGGNSSSNSGGGAGGSSAATSAQTSSVSFSGLSVWKGIENSIQSMLSASGKVVVTPATGTVTVTDIPNVIELVDQFIERQNQSLSRQVVVNVRVLAVDLSNTSNYGINWDAVYSAISNRWGLSFNSGITPITGAGNLTLSVLNAAGGKGWTGSQAVIEALSKQGRVSNVTSANVTTINNQPTPIQVGRQQSYVQSTATTMGGGIGQYATTSVTPGTITTGFSMTVLPHILDKNKLMLQYSMDLSSLLSLESITTGGTTVQLPNLETRNFLQRVITNSGDTIVVTGFESSEQSAKKQGILSADSVALGGSVAGINNRSVIVVLIQPVIVD